MTVPAMRIGILAIQHESNTFVSTRTTMAEFQRDALLTGEAMRAYCRDCQHETGGFWGQLQAEGYEFVPLLLALATPGGPLSEETATELVDRALSSIRNAVQLDGLLVAPHGAAVAEGIRDFDGHWLQLVRAEVGAQTPIVGTLDPHANISSRMVAATDALVAYRTNPHVDQHHTGRIAASLLARAVRGEVTLTQAFAQPPLAISIDRQATSESPCAALYHLANKQLEAPAVLSNSIALGFPYADVEEMGTSFIAVTDGQPTLANTMVDQLTGHLLERRHDFACGLPNVDEAMQVVSNTSDRVCLLDVGDNVGGGAAGDGTLLARNLLNQRVIDSLVCLWDPSAVRAAMEFGIGQRAEITIAGREATEQGPPLVARVVVQRLGDGRFTESAPVHGGRNTYDMGPTAVVQCDDGPTLLLMSKRVPPFSLGQLTSCDLDPMKFRVIVAKGVNAPIAAYREVCDRFIRVDTPGITCANMTQLDYQHRRRPLFPFEEID